MYETTLTHTPTPEEYAAGFQTFLDATAADMYLQILASRQHGAFIGNAAAGWSVAIQQQLELNITSIELHLRQLKEAGYDIRVAAEGGAYPLHSLTYAAEAACYTTMARTPQGLAQFPLNGVNRLEFVPPATPVFDPYTQPPAPAAGTFHMQPGDLLGPVPAGHILDS